jgi:subtilisin family serine protease
MRKTLVFLAILLLASAGTAQLLDSNETETYIITYDSSSFDRSVLDQFELETVFDYNIIDGMAVKMTPATATSVESLDSIESVQPDIPIFLPVMDGDGDDSSRDSYGGSGTVAVLDTGVDDDHIDLEGQVISHQDVRPGSSDPEDYHGHGTHVSSILAGTGEGNQEYEGIAPDAKIRNYKVLDDTGGGDMSTAIKGVEEASKDSDVLVLSLGAKVDECDGTDPLSRAVDNAAEKGVAVVVAAGNEGPGSRTVTSPGCAEKAFTVGSSHLQEEVSDFSSRGPTADGRLKPDIVAQGENIMAAEAQTRSDYTSKSGTSMAAPYVAGAVAVLMEEKDASNTEYFNTMTETAFTLDEDRYAEGNGNINITAAQERFTGESSDGSDRGDSDSSETGQEQESTGTDQGSKEESTLDRVETDSSLLRKALEMFQTVIEFLKNM